MIDDSLIFHLKQIGMSEYEAKVYGILSALRIASAREIHEQTGIPRGRIYETLSSLTEKGFIASSGISPVRFTPLDATRTIERLKKESVEALEGLHQQLKALETETMEPNTKGYELRTEWTRENQILMMLKRAKSEIILLCNDEDLLIRYKSEISRSAKRIPVYLVIQRVELAEFIQVKCYHGGNDIDSSLFRHNAGENLGITMKLMLMADRRESVTIMEENNNTTGIFICPDIYASYLSRKILQEIEPIDNMRKRRSIA